MNKCTLFHYKFIADHQFNSWKGIMILTRMVCKKPNSNFKCTKVQKYTKQSIVAIEKFNVSHNLCVT